MLQGKLKKLNKLIIFILLVIALAPLCIYFINFPSKLSKLNSDWATFGSYIGGVYGAMAFFAVAYSIYITGVQFRKQHEDNIFFRSVDDLLSSFVRHRELDVSENRDTNSTISLLVNDFNNEITKLSSHLARVMLCKKPKFIPATNITKIVISLPRHVLGYNIENNNDNLINAISKCNDFNECWEQLKEILGGASEENVQIREALEAAGSVLFYKVGFKERVYYYEMAWDTIIKQYDEDINRYIKNIDFILYHVHLAKRKKLYMRYLTSRLTKYDIAFLFYFTAIDSDLELISRILESGILNEIKRSECRRLLFDYLSEEQSLAEIECIRDRVKKDCI